MISTQCREPRTFRFYVAGTRQLAVILSVLMVFPPTISKAAVAPPPAGDAQAATSEAPGTRAGGEWASLAQKRIEESEYEITWQQQTTLESGRAAWQAPNRAQRFRTYFLEHGIRIVPRTEAEPSWKVELGFLGYGRGRDVRPAPEARLFTDAKRIDYRRGGLVEWYVNSPDGLEHGFTLSRSPEDAAARREGGTVFVPGARRDRPAGESGREPAFISLRIDGDLVPQLSADGQAVEFAPPAGGPIVLRYSALEVRDANGRALRSWMERFHDGGVTGIRLVFDDSDAAYPVTVDPVATNASWRAEGDQDSAHFGWSVASAGDVNGDTFDDVVIGAPLYDNGQTDEGRAYVFLGSASGLAPTPAWTAEGNQNGAQFGYSVASAGDVNGDGYDDVVIGAPYYSHQSLTRGRVFVYQGSAFGLSSTAAWQISPTLTGTEFGWSVASAGSVNGNAYADIIVGAPRYSNGQTQEGRAFVFHGSFSGLNPACAAGTDPSCYAEAANWIAESDQANAHLGISVAAAGDVNNDDYDDVVIGVPDYNGGLAGEGRALVFRGSPTGLGPTVAWSFESNQANAYLGYSVASAGDVNGDTYDDVLVGAPNYDSPQSNEGRALVFFGADAGLSTTANWVGESDQVGALFGRSVASAGDVNGDGYDDILVAAPYYDNPATDEGRVSLFYGSADGLGNYPAKPYSWAAEGNQFGASFGFSVSSAGDVNGDRYADVLVGAPYYHRGQAEEGTARVFHGAARLTNVSLAQQLGLAGVASQDWWVVSGTTTLNRLTESPDAVSYGPIPGSILLSTGRASDGGLGNTDWGDTQADKTYFNFTLNIPADRRTLCVTTQFITSETTFTIDRAWFEFTRNDGATTDPSGIYELSDLATQSKNPPIAHCIDVDAWTSIELRFRVEDRTNGLKDSALLISRVYFSTLPMPPDVETDTHGYMKNPAPQDVSGSSGTYSYGKQLFSVPGVSMPFSLSLSYNSASTNKGAVGPKWVHSYEAEARKLPDGSDANSNPDTILVRTGGNSSEYFKENDAGTGVYAPKFDGSFSKLTLNNDTDKTISYVTKDNRTYWFGKKVDANKLLLSKVTDAGGNFFLFGYDTTYRLTSITDTRGKTFTLTHHGTDNRLSEVRLDWTDGGESHSSKVTLAYDDSTGLLRSLTDPSGSSTRFTYTPDGRLLAATDDDEVTLVSNTYEHYDGLGVNQDGDRLATQRNGSDPDPFDPEAGVSFWYAAESVVRSDRLARQDTTAYDVRGRAAWQLDRTGVRQAFAYDRNNKPIEMRRTLPGETAAKIASSSAYDVRGNPLTQFQFPGLCVGGGSQALSCILDANCAESSCGSRTDMSYDVRNNLRSRTDHYGNTTIFDYDAQDNLIRERDAVGNEINHVYSTVGSGGAVRPVPTTTVDPRGNASACAYDDRGYLISAAGPTGGVTTHTYDDLGHRTSTTDPNGNKTCFRYDDGGLLLAQTADCGRCAGGSSNGAACTNDAACPGGRCGLQVVMTYDAQGRPVSRTEPDGAVFRYAYTPTGQIREESDPLGHLVSYEYDAEDRLVSRLNHHPQDRPGLAPEIRTTKHAYDAGDRLTDVRVYDADHPDCPANAVGCLTAAQATYDALGNLTSVTDPGSRVTTWDHDLLGRVTSETDELDTVRYAYDGSGLLTSRKSAVVGRQVDYAYDAAGRLTEVATPEFSIAHRMDANGNRTWSRLGSTTPVVRSFDSLDRMNARTDEFGNTVRYSYDAAGNLIELVYPSDLNGDGQADRVRYTYDRLNRMKTVTDWGGRTTSYAYDAAGNLASISLPDGATVTYTYDAARRLTGVNDSLGGQPIFAATYTVNAAGLWTSAQRTLPLEPTFSPSTQNLTYGAANTLTSSGSARFHYDYDAAGNLVDGTLAGTSVTLSYNSLNQLVSVTGGVGASHTYDADGLRVKSVKGGVARRFVYDVTARNARLLEEHDANGNVVARYAYGLGLVSRLGAEGVRVYHFDTGGNTLALTSLAGTVTDRYAYDPYGHPAGRMGGSGNPFTFAGRDGVYDDGNGLLYMRSRYYAPELMRFVQKDQAFTGSVADPLSLNRYAYARGNPLLGTDPNGLWLTALVGAVVGAAINVLVACLDGCDAGEIAGAAVEGALTGAFIGAGGFLLGIGVGALGGAAGWGVEAGLAELGVGNGPDTSFGARVGLGAAGGAVGGLGKSNAGPFKKATEWAADKGLKKALLKQFTGEAVKDSFTASISGFALGKVPNGEGRDGDDRDDGGTDGTATDNWNPISAPQPGPQRTTAPGSCASEVWR